MAGVPWQRRISEGITTDDLLNMLGLPSVMTVVLRHQTRWLGHLARMEHDRLPRQSLFGMAPDRAGSRFGREGTTYRMLTAQARQLVQALPGVDARTWAINAQDREGCRTLVRGLTEKAVTDARAEAQEASVSVAASSTTFPCPICGFVCMSEGGLSNHLQLMHPVTQVRFDCDQCSRSFPIKQAP